MRALPLLSGIITVSLLYLTINELMKRKQALLTVALIVLSPSFIYAHVTYNRVFLALIFSILGAYLLLKNKFLLSLASFSLVIIFNLNLFYIVLLTIIIFYAKSRKKSIVLPTLALIAVSVIVIATSAPPQRADFLSLLRYYFSDLGAIVGLGIFNVILAVLGIINSWKDKEKHAIIYFSIMSLLICSYYQPLLTVFLSLFLNFYGGLGLLHLIKSKWSSQLLKNYVILLFVCGFVFSAGSYITYVSEQGPSYQEVLSLEWLENQSPSQLVLSHYDYGYLIQAVSGAQSYLTKQDYTLSLEKSKIKTTDEIFMSRNLEKILGFMQKNNIGYIWINNRMKSGQVWSREDQGILLVLENSIHFEKIYSYQDVEIWLFEPLED